MGEVTAMVQVDSEAITDVEYDSATATLRIRFTDGDWYSYLHVSAAVHRALMTAESHGRFFQSRIRDRYPYARE